jgi:NTP pyrophosphatase (non-canonical NTP hydrolase)
MERIGGPFETEDEARDFLTNRAREAEEEETSWWASMGIDRLAALIEWTDADLDAHASQPYQESTLAQDWARVAKVVEEAGEAVDALIGFTGQNPRKGAYGSQEALLAELADVALTGLYAIQHFTKNRHATIGHLMLRAEHHKARRESQLGEPDAGG